MPIIECCPGLSFPPMLNAVAGIGCEESIADNIPLAWDDGKWTGKKTLVCGDTWDLTFRCTPDGFRLKFAMDCQGINEFCTEACAPSGSWQCNPLFVQFLVDSGWSEAGDCKCCPRDYPGIANVNIVENPVPIPPYTPRPKAPNSCDVSTCCENTCCPTDQPPNSSSRPVRYATGEMLLQVSDLTSSAGRYPWMHTRNFQNRLTADLNVGNGYNWQIQQWPRLAFESDTIVLVGTELDAVWFDRDGDEYFPRYGVKWRLEAVPDDNLLVVLDTDGRRYEFDDVSGILKRIADPAGDAWVVVAMSNNGYTFTTVERQLVDQGGMAVERAIYEYSTAPGDDLLQRLEIRRSENGTTWLDVERVDYTYYSAGSPHGTNGDLATVTTSAFTGGSWVETGTTLYRYYLAFPSSSSSSSSSSSGATPVKDPRSHLLKLVLLPASYARMIADGHNPLTVSDGAVALYADYYFEYDDDRRVTKETLQGGSQTFLFDYQESGFTDGYNVWKTKTIETLPDGNQNVVYCNASGQPMLRIFRSPDSGVNWSGMTVEEWEGLTLNEWSSFDLADKEWCTFFKYDDSGRSVLTARPSAVAGYDEEQPDLLQFDSVTAKYLYLRDDDGLIETKTYHTCSGNVASEGLRKGQLGTLIKLREYEYTCCGPGCDRCSSSSSSSMSSSLSSSSHSTYPIFFSQVSGTWFRSKETVYPSDVDQAKKIVTTYAYTFYPETCAVQERITTLPAIPVDQNGTGVAATRREYFDSYGNRTWAMDERGYISRIKYDIPTGAVTRQIDDVDTSIETDHPTGWTTPVDGGLNLITDYEHDNRGRMIQSLGPSHTIDLDGSAMTIRRTTWMNYLESASARTTRTGQGHATGSDPSYTYTLVNPVSIAVTDLAGKLQQQIQAARASTSGKLLPSDTFVQSTYTRWQTVQYTDCCNVASQRAYHTIPSSGEGTEGTNYDQTDFGYDVMKRRNRTVTPGGTITRLVFDARGLVTSTWVGTNDDGASADDPSGGGLDPDNNMVVVTSNVFDDGEAGLDGSLTEQTQHVSATESRVTAFVYDWRDRRVDTDGEIDVFQRVTYDNLNRVVETRRYDTDDSGNLIAKSETKYDDRGRVFRAIRYGVNPSTGVVGHSLTDNIWFDPAGNVLESLPSGSKLFTKAVYDSLGRRTVQYLGYTPESSGSSSSSSSSGGESPPDSVENDVILEQSESVYDNASNIVESIVRQRYHDALDTQLGPLEDPANDPKARVTYAAMYPDPLGRMQATADYGTNGGTALTRSDTVPTPADDILVSLTAHDEAGDMLSTTDPSGMVTRMGYDDLGRVIEQIQNYRIVVNSSSSSSSCDGCCPSDDTNVTVRTSYNADGNVETLTAVNAVAGDQVTTYVYGTTLDDSSIATSTLKRKEVYPDSVDEDDVIDFAYNRQSQVTTRTDQNGTVHSYDYDLLGRMTQDRVTAVGTGVDDAVLRIGTTYEVRSLREKVTSYDDPEVGSGDILNEIQSEYNDFGQLITEYQSHDGAVNTMSTPTVQYDYADGLDNTIRQTLLVYPNGRELTYSYGEAGGISDAASRVKAIIDDDDTHLVEYEYVGRGTFVVADDTEPQVKWTLVDLDGEDDPDTGDIYSGLDRFGRIKDNRWYNYEAEEDVDRLQYGYDRASSRIWRANLVAQSLSKEFDEIYTYDGIHRLKDMERGLLNGPRTALTSRTFAQCWTLDSTGNWSGMKEADTGAAWTLEQRRTASEVNEITDIANTIGAAWAQPAYDSAGNMTTMPQPNSPVDTFHATYDAWNRLVRIVDGEQTDGTYEYDGLRRRIVSVSAPKPSGSSSSSGPEILSARHIYFTFQWQAIEDRVSTDVAAERQFIWGVQYTDNLLMRDRDHSASGSVRERLYVSHDANWNVTSVFSPTAIALEYYIYSAYGHSAAATAQYDVRGESSYEWETLYCGYRADTSLGLYSVRYRTYHCTLGVWTQRDIIHTEPASLYEYVMSRPLILTDPTGALAFAIPIAYYAIVAIIGAGLAVVILINGRQVVVPVCEACIDTVVVASTGVVAVCCVLLARKEDIKQIDRIAGKYDLDAAQRRRLHDEMAKGKCKGETLTEAEIIAILCTIFPGKCTGEEFDDEENSGKDDGPTEWE